MNYIEHHRHNQSAMKNMFQKLWLPFDAYWRKANKCLNNKLYAERPARYMHECIYRYMAFYIPIPQIHIFLREQ